jgi:hypothetical protein
MRAGYEVEHCHARTTVSSGTLTTPRDAEVVQSDHRLGQPDTLGHVRSLLHVAALEGNDDAGTADARGGYRAISQSHLNAESQNGPLTPTQTRGT